MRFVKLLLALATLYVNYGIEDNSLSFDAECCWGRLWATVEFGPDGIIVEEWGT